MIPTVRYERGTARRRPTDVVDRIYVREPGGVLFEMVTPEPGFTVDEKRAELGPRLVVPDWLEDDRERIEAQLPRFDGPPTGGD